MKKSFLAAVFIFLTVLTFCAEVLAPVYTQKNVENGILYSFAVQKNERVHYRIYDPISGSIAKGVVSSDGSFLVPTGASTVVWTQNSAGTNSRPVSLDKKNDSPVTDSFDLADSLQVLSPASGEWANRQVLLLNVPRNAEVYYSYGGADPLLQGFAYDGPALIEADGDVALRITAVFENKQIVEKNILYTVKASSEGSAPFRVSNAQPFLELGDNRKLQIPEKARYVLSDFERPYLTESILSDRSVVDRGSYLPLVLETTDGLYRYMIRHNCLQGRPLSDTGKLQKKVQVSVIDWNFVTFASDSFVYYSLDGEPWKTYSEPIFIDRSTAHKIYWRENNETVGLLLPKKPNLIGIPAGGISKDPVSISANDSAYTLVLEQSDSYSNLASIGQQAKSVLFFDTIGGDETSYSLRFGLYAGSVRQGSLDARFTIDRKPPVSPVLSTAFTGLYSRNPVPFTITANDKSDYVYTCVLAEKTLLPFGALTWPSVVALPQANQFFRSDNKQLVLNADGEYALRYSVFAYAMDAVGNVSKPIQYFVVVDQNNYYVKSHAQEDSTSNAQGDGSPADPFTTIQAAANVLNSREYTRLIVQGEFNNLTNINLSADCTILGDGKTTLRFLPDAKLAIQNATVQIDGCIFSRNAPVTAVASPKHAIQQALVFADRSNLKLDNSSFAINGGNSIAALVLENSLLTAQNVQLTLKARQYAAAVSARNSKINADKLDIAVEAPAAVAVTVTGGSLDLTASSCVVSASLGRAVELFDSTYRLESTVYELNNVLDKATAPVWADSASRVKE